MRKKPLISFGRVWTVKNTCADTSRKCCNISCAFQVTLVHMAHVKGMTHTQAIGLGRILQLALLILFSNLGFCEDFLQSIYMTNEWNELQSCIAETSNAVNRICQHELKSVQQIAPRCYRGLLSCLMSSYSVSKRILTKESVSLARQAFLPQALLFVIPCYFCKSFTLRRLQIYIFLITKFRCRSSLTVWGFLLVRVHVHGTSFYTYLLLEEFHFVLQELLLRAYQGPTCCFPLSVCDTSIAK